MAVYYIGTYDIDDAEHATIEEFIVLTGNAR